VPERLLSVRGDMLFIRPAAARSCGRLHGPFVGDHYMRSSRFPFILREQAPEYRMEMPHQASERVRRRRAGADIMNGVRQAGSDLNGTIKPRISIESIGGFRIGLQPNPCGAMVEASVARKYRGCPPDGAKPREVRLRGANYVS